MYCVFSIIMFEKLSPTFNFVDIKITRLDFDNFTNSTRATSLIMSQHFTTSGFTFAVIRQIVKLASE